MTFALGLIRLVTPAAEREWVIGDTLERFDEIARARGARAAAQWVRREALRSLYHAARHRLAVLRSGLTQAHRSGDSVMTTFGQDVRHALRLLRRSPGFAFVAIVTLALGIGANTAMFAVVDGSLLKRLPFDDPDRLMLVHLLAPDFERPGAMRESVWSYPKALNLLRSAADIRRCRAVREPGGRAGR